MSYDKEIVKYEVMLEDFVPSTGRYRVYGTREFGTEEEAVDYARKNMASYRITVRVIENIAGWWWN